MRLTIFLLLVASTTVLIEGAPVPESRRSSVSAASIINVDRSITSSISSVLQQRDAVESRTNSTSKDDEMKGDEPKGDELKPGHIRSHPSLSIRKRAPTTINSPVQNVFLSQSYGARVIEGLEELPLAIYLITILPWWLMLCVRLADWAICYRRYSENRLQEVEPRETPHATEFEGDEVIARSRFDLTLALIIPLGWPFFLWHLFTSIDMQKKARQAADAIENQQRHMWLEEEQQQKGEREALLPKQRKSHYRVRFACRDSVDPADWNGPFALTSYDTDSSDDDFHRSYSFGVGMVPGRAPIRTTSVDIFDDEGSDFSSSVGRRSTRGTRSSSISSFTL